MWHPLAAIEAAVLLGSPSFLVAPSLKVGLNQLWQEHSPRAFEASAGLVEGRGGTVGTFATVQSLMVLFRPC
jgi:hypothetical protein